MKIKMDMKQSTLVNIMLGVLFIMAVFLIGKVLGYGNSHEYFGGDSSGGLIELAGDDDEDEEDEDDEDDEDKEYMEMETDELADPVLKTTQQTNKSGSKLEEFNAAPQRQRHGEPLGHNGKSEYTPV